MADKGQLIECGLPKFNAPSVGISQGEKARSGGNNASGVNKNVWITTGSISNPSNIAIVKNANYNDISVKAISIARYLKAF